MSDFTETDRAYMRLALEAAHQAASKGEVPIGAVVVQASPNPGGSRPASEVLACCHNQPIALHDPTAHAEVLALRHAGATLQNYRLDGCDLYVTLEPCAMCAQAILHARVRRVIFGAAEPKTGAAGSVLNLFALPALNHQTQVQGGLFAEESQALLQHFFAEKRRVSKQSSTPLPDTALRTPPECFETVWRAYPGAESVSRYEQDLPELQGLRLHALDLGPPDSDTVWLGLHDHTAWWPQLWTLAQTKLAHHHRVLLPDLIGFGMSDKPKKQAWHDLHKHVTYLIAWLKKKNIKTCWITYAKNQKKLAERIKAAMPDTVMGITALDGKLLDHPASEILLAPFPDEGHQAGPKAWAEHGWEH